MTSTPVSEEVHRLRPIETAANYTDHTAHQQSQRVTGIAWRMISQNEKHPYQQNEVYGTSSQLSRDAVCQDSDYRSQHNGRKGTDHKHCNQQ